MDVEWAGLAHVTCPACGGTGRYELPDGDTQRCAFSDCSGTGTIIRWAAIIDGIWIESTHTETT